MAAGRCGVNGCVVWVTNGAQRRHEEKIQFILDAQCSSSGGPRQRRIMEAGYGGMSGHRPPR